MAIIYRHKRLLALLRRKQLPYDTMSDSEKDKSSGKLGRTYFLSGFKEIIQTSRNCIVICIVPCVAWFSPTLSRLEGTLFAFDYFRGMLLYSDFLATSGSDRIYVCIANM